MGQKPEGDTILEERSILRSSQCRTKCQKLSGARRDRVASRRRRRSEPSALRLWHRPRQQNGRVHNS